MKKLNLSGFVATLVMLAALVSGCERRQLESIVNLTQRVVVKCTWEVDAYPEGERPTGITLYIFKDGEFYSSVTTSNVDSPELHLGKGTYRMYMISQSVDEFATMKFYDMSIYPDARSVLEPASADWATRGPNELVVQDPEVLLAGTSEEFSITDEAVIEYQSVYEKWRAKKKLIDSGSATGEDAEEYARLEEQVEYSTIHVPIKARDVVSQFWVTIYVGNADMLQSMRASISGMARTFDLTRDVTDVEKATQVLRYWSLGLDDNLSHIGHVDGIITTFGLPEGETPSTLRDSTLNVSALLIDNETVADYVFNVGDKIQELTPNPGYRNLYRLVFGSVYNPAIELPDVTPVESGGGGFTADVTDWEEEIEAEIPI